jgi:UPF0716 family protein affecting phage T7 exclusion
MPLIFLALLIGLPILDIYATLRFAEALGVPGILLFIPGLVAGVMVLTREAKSLRVRFTGAIQSLSLHTAVFDSGRRLLAALLFLAPGFVSDVFAVFLLLIPNRALASSNGMNGMGRMTGMNDTVGRPPTRGGSGNNSVVDGEYRRVD